MYGKCCRRLWIRNKKKNISFALENTPVISLCRNVDGPFNWFGPNPIYLNFCLR